MNLRAATGTATASVYTIACRFDRKSIIIRYVQRYLLCFTAHCLGLIHDLHKLCICEASWSLFHSHSSTHERWMQGSIIHILRSWCCVLFTSSRVTWWYWGFERVGQWCFHDKTSSSCNPSTSTPMHLKLKANEFIGVLDLWIEITKFKRVTNHCHCQQFAW